MLRLAGKPVWQATPLVTSALRRRSSTLLTCFTSGVERLPTEASSAIVSPSFGSGSTTSPPSPLNGMLSIDTLSRLVSNGSIDTVVVAFTDIYGRLLGKRFDAEFFLKHVVEGGTHACTYLFTCDVDMRPLDVCYSFHKSKFDCAHVTDIFCCFF